MSHLKFIHTPRNQFIFSATLEERKKKLTGLLGPTEYFNLLYLHSLEGLRKTMSNSFKTNNIPTEIRETGNPPEHKAVQGLRHLLLKKCGEYIRSRSGQQSDEEKTSLPAVHTLLHLISLS
jgi:hypothetical protein